MRKMRMMIPPMVIAIVATLNMNAQGPGGGPGGGPGRGMSEEDIVENVASMAETLDMSKEQEEKALKVELDFYNKIQIERQKMRNSGTPPSTEQREAMREKMTTMRDQRDEKFKEILTDEQYEQWRDIQEKRRSEMQQQRRSNPNGEGDSERPSRGRGRG